MEIVGLHLVGFLPLRSYRLDVVVVQRSQRGHNVRRNRVKADIFIVWMDERWLEH
jgi:hypothetical protein